MDFLGVGPGELILILIIALIVFGPQRLPELAASVGKALREFRQMSQEITQDISKEFGAVSETLSETTAELQQAGSETENETKKSKEAAE